MLSEICEHIYSIQYVYFILRMAVKYDTSERMEEPPVLINATRLVFVKKLTLIRTKISAYPRVKSKKLVEKVSTSGLLFKIGS